MTDHRVKHMVFLTVSENQHLGWGGGNAKQSLLFHWYEKEWSTLIGEKPTSFGVFGVE